MPITSPNPQAQKLNRDIHECIYFAALKTSNELAKVRQGGSVLWDVLSPLGTGRRWPSTSLARKPWVVCN